MIVRQAALSSPMPRIKNITLGLCGSLFMALLAQLKITLWFTPVPISMQTFGVLMIGSLFSPRVAFSSLMLYLFEGAIGLPVFAGGSTGLAVLIGSSAGYLWCWPFVAYGIAKLRFENPLHNFVVLCLGSFTILACGTLWLGCLIGWNSAFQLGFYPFIPGNLMKICLAFSTLYLTKGVGHMINKA
jgi:biotin transport system substrate-specific component